MAVMTSVFIALIFKYCQVEYATERSVYRDPFWKQEHLQTKYFSIQFHPHLVRKKPLEVTAQLINIESLIKFRQW